MSVQQSRQTHLLASKPKQRAKDAKRFHFITSAGTRAAGWAKIVSEFVTEQILLRSIDNTRNVN